MCGRFNKSGGSAVSFFAFQDVITGTTGFLVIITIFLALNLDEVISVSHQADPKNAVAEALQKVLEQIVTLKKQVATTQLAPGETRDTLVRMIEDLKQSISRLSPIESAATKLPKEESMLDREVRLEVRKLQAALDESMKLLPDATDKAALAESKLATLESQIKNAEERLQQSIGSKNVLRLIPERSSTNKEPMLIVVKKTSLQLQFFDGTPAQVCNSVDELLSVLQAYPGIKYYVVIYFKPSGALRFNDLNKALRQNGYEIGYDLIGEEIELKTTPSAP